MATISLKSVRKSFGKTEVIHGVDIDIEDRELIVIVGPSGCGKSTLLRMVAGLETVTSGEVHIDGKRVNELEPMDRNIAMVFQNYALYPHMSVFDNMAYGLKIARTPKAEIKQRVVNTAKLLELEPFLARKPRELSGGQRQRVAMGRAIVRKPALFLFDEPLSNLDAKLRVQMRLEIKGLQQELGVTSLYVTHDQVEAMTLADRMLVMNAGAAEQIGTPLEVYQNPATVFVAGFIGSPPMNFLPPEALSESAENARLLDGLAARAARGPLTVGIRPEHLEICDAAAARLKGRVRYAEILGAESLVHLALEGGRLLTVRQSGGAKLPEAGEQCAVRFDDPEVRAFDESGKRIAVA
jgi:sn-glycerol 3-phosphate transport system ATP-binding protein